MQPPETLKTIFFDLDGPIIDVAPKFYYLYTEMFSAGGHPVLSINEYWNLKRNKVPEPQIAARTAPQGFIDGYVPERIRVIEDIKYLEHDCLIDGARDVLDSLHGRYQLILVTLRNRRENLMWELKHLDLIKYFDHILTKEDNHGDFKIKVELITGYLQGKKPAGIIIGDTESDIKAGKTLGLKTVAVCCGIRTKEYLQALAPDYIIDSINQLSEVLAREDIE